MKILVTGAGGMMGSFVAKTLLEMKGITEITLADLRPSSFDYVPDNPTPKVRCEKLDITNTSQTVTLFAEHDLVLNAVGPFYRFGEIALRAAISAKTNFADMCDDWRPTVNMLALSDEARKCGITAIIGVGASPGISNMLAVHAAKNRPDLTQLYTAWAIEPEELVSYASTASMNSQMAAIHHLVHELVSPFLRVRNGALALTDSLELVQFDWNNEQKLSGYTVGHPEGITLKSQFPELMQCANLMVSRHDLHEFFTPLKLDYQSGIEVEEISNRLARGFYSTGAAQFDLPKRLFAVAMSVSKDKVSSTGVTLSHFPSGGMAGITSVPLALMSQLFTEFEDLPKGVFAPEQVIDSDWFFDRLKPYCNEIHIDHPDFVVCETWNLEK